jgi:hypothetical protein
LTDIWKDALIIPEAIQITGSRGRAGLYAEHKGAIRSKEFKEEEK